MHVDDPPGYRNIQVVSFLCAKMSENAVKQSVRTKFSSEVKCMSLMANLYVGQSGLITSQSALNTTAHNLANIDTEGFTRQQVSQGT